MRTKLTISRHWNRPEITTTINSDKIALSMDIADFITALKQEIGSVMWVFTKAEFDKRLDASIAKIIKGVKEESVKAV